MTWLVRHEGRSGELTALLKDGWSWEDISLAMQLAGVGYRPGVPINPQTLRQKAYQARSRVRAWAEKERASRAMAVADQPQRDNPPPIPALPIQPSAWSKPHEMENPDGTPQFRTVRFRDPPPPRPETKPIYPPLPPRQAVDAETAIARMFGRPLPQKDDG